jgi:ATP-binding cassette subfamily B protein
MPVLSLLWIGLPLLIGLLIIPGFGAQRDLIDRAITGLSEEGNSNGAARLMALTIPLAIFIGVSLISKVLSTVQNISDERFRNRASMFIQGEVHQRAIHVPLERMDQEDYYDRLQRAEAAAGSELTEGLKQLFVVIRLLFEIVGLLLIGLLAYPLVGIIMAFTFGISLFIRLESDTVKRRLNRDLTRSGRLSDYLQQMMTQSETVRDMRVSGSNEALIDKWGAEMQHSLSQRMNANRREIRRGVIVSLIQITCLVVAIIAMLLQMRSGTVSTGMIVIVFQAMWQANRLSATLSFPLGKIYIQSSKLMDLIVFLQEVPDKPEQAGTTALTPGPRGRIELSNVTYSYKAAAEPYLRDIQLVLEPGEVVALVGENGAGKSTLVRLILGLYQPTDGTITWDGVDYTNLNPKLLRESMSAVFQDFFRFHTTLRDNVAFAKPDESISEEDIVRALRQAGAEQLLSLLGGLDSAIGMLSEGGRELSGGQWQRLALARAAIRDTQLIVLDEPTAAIDPQHESELYRSFRELAVGRTVLFVSHRLGWARFADRIVVMRNGRIVEQGKHDQLLLDGKQYAAMFKAQAEWYGA